MDKLYQRNFIKDNLQNYILYFIYNSRDFKELIFTGGTCLRKMYRLPRLSEDLDFDYKERFNIDIFLKKTISYLLSLKKFSFIDGKIANNKKTVFFKFKARDFLKNTNEKEVIFVRCDLSQIDDKFYQTEVLPFNSLDFNFFIKCYTLSDLFANKLIAFLERDFFKGKEQKISFKGRDIFDIYWFLDLSSKSGFNLKPNWKKIKKRFYLSKKDFIEKIKEKLIKINEKDVKTDLMAFIESQEYLKNFLINFRKTIIDKIDFII